jgi:hypothetical protein
MIKKIPFDLFKEGHTIYFDIVRIIELEERLGDSILNVIRRNEAGMKFCLNGLIVGLKHNYEGLVTPDMIIEKIEKYFDNGGNLDQLAVPVIRALLDSGILGRKQKENERKNEAEKQ